MNWNLDFSDASANDVDLAAGNIPDGWYRAKLADVREDEESGDGKLQFQVVAGLHTGKKITENLSNPMLQTEEKKIKSAMQKARLFGIRLGLIPRDLPAGQHAGADFTKAIGREVIIHVKARSFMGRDGKMVTDFPGLNYGGVYPFDHKDIPPGVRIELELPLLPGQKAPAAAPAAKGATATTPPPVTTAASGTSPSTGATPAAATQNSDQVAANLWG